MIDVPARHRPLFDALSKHQIDYRLVQSGPRLTTVLVREPGRARLPKLMKAAGYRALLHPYGKWYGYHFLYQLREFQLYARGEDLVEVYFALPCMSLTPMTWIPLDKLINDGLWQKATARDGVSVLDPETEFIHRLTRCVFQQAAFDADSRAYLSQALPDLDEASLTKKLWTVFFKFTPPLLARLRQGEFDPIITEYHRFSAY